jgi:hypothetical protein
MPITERTLKRWRGDALKLDEEMSILPWVDLGVNKQTAELLSRILRMTSELLDIELLKKRKQ